MRSYTHIAGALLLFITFTYLVNLNNLFLGIFFAGWISFFPDILDRLLGEHRGVGHSIFWLIPFGLLGFWNLTIAAALMIGMISHLLLDILTTHGCPILYPLWKTNFVVLSEKRRIKTGTNQDIAVFIVLLFLLIPVLYFTLPTHIGKNPSEQNLIFASNGSNEKNTISNTTDTMKNNFYFNLQLTPKINENITVKKVDDNETTVIVKDIEPGG